MELAVLRKKRIRMLLLNLAYFLVLLVIGIFLFLTGAGRWIYLPAAAAIVFYLLLVRPVRKNYENDLRTAILQHSVLDRLQEASYQRKEGLPSSYLIDAGFINVIDPRSYLSRERISGNAGRQQVEMADVVFPFRENGLNKMFNGCLIHIVNPGADYPELMVRGGDFSALSPGREKKLIEKLGSYIPGSLSLHRAGDTLSILLRGRFIGFPINPLGEVNESTLNSDPLPEFGTALELARLNAKL